MVDARENRIAVIGFGPRGLGALEALAAACPKDGEPLAVDIFEGSETLGAGPNFDPAEIESCRLNIPLRDIDFRPPSTSSQGRFADWLPAPVDMDTFPARSQLGQYLAARVGSLQRDGRLSLTVRSDRVAAIDETDAGWMLDTLSDQLGPYSEVLVTIGQPAVKPDDQKAEWQDHAETSDGELVAAYPARELARQAQDWAGQTVAIRGLALSAFDVIQALTVSQGGTFDGQDYVASGREPARIVPFSLDGRPPFPKPETEEIDTQFEPSEAETKTFLKLMRKAAQGEPGDVPRLITAGLAPAVERIRAETAGSRDQGDVIEWLDTEWEDAGSQESGGPLEILRDGIAMAEGRRTPSIGYIVGQVWRKLQDQVRQGFNPVETPPETAKVIIGFDEGLKRYSYGPPMTSSRELLTLSEAGIVDLEFTKDPYIKTVPEGWTLRCRGREVTARIMVDAVLPSPALPVVTDPLICGLADDCRMCAVAEGLGVQTAPDGTLQGADRHGQPGLALLGRLALGSVIAVDSLHDCFGASAERWAVGVMQRRA